MINLIKFLCNCVAILLVTKLNAQNMEQKEFEKIEKTQANELIKKYDGVLQESISTDAGQVFVLSNGRAIIMSSYEPKAVYYYNSDKFTKDPYEDDEILSNQSFFANFEENRQEVIKYIDSLYPVKDIGSFFEDNDNKRQSNFLHTVLLKDKNHVSYRNGMIFIGEIINFINGFEWRIERKTDIRINKEIVMPYLYDPVRNEKVHTQYFKQLMEYNNGDRKKIYL